jgi:hypothetical protein
VLAELISRKTRNEFREYLVSWPLREIETEFDSAGIRPRLDYQPPVGGQRRTLVEQYYAAIDFSSRSDVERLLRVYEAVLITASNIATAQKGTADLPPVALPAVGS